MLACDEGIYLLGIKHELIAADEVAELRAQTAEGGLDVGVSQGLIGSGVAVGLGGEDEVPLSQIEGAGLDAGDLFGGLGDGLAGHEAVATPRRRRPSVS